jgi:peptide-methionine (R)-S-oxide reductase
MSRQLLYRWILHVGTACCLMALAIGCTPPEPADVGRPVSPGATSDGISPSVTSVPELTPIEEPKMEEPAKETGEFAVQKTDAEWKALLSPEQYRITRLKDTERAFTGKYWNTKTAGTYECVCCGQALFSSNAKFDSGCGWPSFFQEIEGAITTEPDYLMSRPRVEIMCSKCGSHLGHVFEDGPPPTGIRHCVNSASVKLVESEEGDE